MIKTIFVIIVTKFNYEKPTGFIICIEKQILYGNDKKCKTRGGLKQSKIFNRN